MVLAIQTTQTCGVACWNAVTEECHCSCNGVNHGILLNDPDALIERQCKIYGVFYKLVGIGKGKDLIGEAERINNSVGWSYISNGNPNYHYHWHYGTKNAPARIKPATKDQRMRWDELAAFRGKEWDYNCYLLWERVEMPETLYCDDECKKCEDHRMKYKYAKYVDAVTPPSEGTKSPVEAAREMGLPVNEVQSND